MPKRMSSAAWLRMRAPLPRASGRAPRVSRTLARPSLHTEPGPLQPRAEAPNVLDLVLLIVTLPVLWRHPVLERFADALSCIDQCFIADEMLEHLPLASRVGKTIVGGIDLNKPRMRQVVEALIALCPSPNGFTASDVA